MNDTTPAVVGAGLKPAPTGRRRSRARAARFV